MSNDKTKHELNEVVEMHRKALEELAEALEQRDALVEAVEMWRVRGNFVPPYVIAALAAVKDLAK
jgi:hypothetical protein